MSKKKRKNSNYKQNDTTAKKQPSSAGKQASSGGKKQSADGKRSKIITAVSALVLVVILLCSILAINSCTRDYTVEISVKDYGKIVLHLDGDSAPKTVRNFVSLVKDGFYDGLTFHRVMDNFMIQGGDPKGNGTGSSDKKIVGEFSKNGYANSISHERGVISMARSMAPNSASSQFFIMHADAPHLDGQYAAFGKVVSGMETVDEIAAIPVGPSDRPRIAMRMKKVYIK